MGLLQAPGLLGSAWDAPAAAVEGSARPEQNRRRAISRIGDYLRWRNPWNLDAGVVCGRGSGFGVAPGVEADPVRGSTGLGARWFGVATAA